jgi:hypothetical protein
MRLPRALLVSILVTLGLTVVLQFFFGLRAFGLFLFLPLGFMFSRRSTDKEHKPAKDDSNHGPDSGPIEPS